MDKITITFFIGLLLMLIAGVLWRKGDIQENFWFALIVVIIDIFSGNLFTTYRSWALILFLIGFFLSLFTFLLMIGIGRVVIG